MPKAALVHNPNAGKGAFDAEDLRARLARHFTVEVATLGDGQSPEDCTRAARACNPDVLVAAGGDGTVSLVASACIESGAPLGVLPVGTSNSIAAALGIPTDIDAAIEAIARGHVRTIDVARANGRMMLLHASAGLHARAVGETPEEAKGRWGVLAYVKKGLAEAVDLTDFDVEITTEHETVRCGAINVTVANLAAKKTLFAQGSGPVSPDDGALDVTILTAKDITDAVAAGWHLLKSAVSGEAPEAPQVASLSARRIRIETTPPQPLLIDGEAAGVGTLTIECIPHELRVFVPRDDGDSMCSSDGSRS